MEINTKPMRDRILSLCRRKPKLADDDLRLIASVWWEEGWHDPELYEHLTKVSSPATILRTRRKLVEEGKIKPSSDVHAARMAEEKRIRENLKK